MEHDYTSDLWVLEIQVPPGRQHYRFTVVDRDETWDAIDPSNPDILLTVPGIGYRLVK